MIEIDWEARLRAAVEETLRLRAARRDERQEFKTRRDVGLAQRHAAKLARIAAESQPNPGDEMPEVPPCCQGLDEPCPQHRQAAQVVRHQGPRLRHAGGGRRVVGEEGRAKPASPEETRG